MKKVSIIYWSNGGNVEVLANAISEGVIESEAKVDIKYVADATIEDILEADAVALGSPAMLNDEIEEVDMKPFINSLSESEINNKPLVLFGSCGWRDTKFIDKWGDLMENYGFNVLEKFTVKDSVEKSDLKYAKEIGELLSK